jgi:hypothetical protein
MEQLQPIIDQLSKTSSSWVPVLAFVLGGLFTAAVGEWRARAAEGRARRQRQEEWERDQAAARLTRLREAVLRDLDETRRFFVEQEAFLLARSEGRVVPHPGSAYPNVDVNLVGDASLAIEQVRVTHELLQLTPATGVPMRLLERAGLLHANYIRALRAQEARARMDQPLKEITEDEMHSIAAEQEALAAKITGSP